MSTTSIIIVAVIAVFVLITLFIVFKIVTAPQLEEPLDFDAGLPPDEESPREEQAEVLDNSVEEPVVDDSLVGENPLEDETEKAVKEYAHAVWKQWQMKTGNFVMSKEEVAHAAACYDEDAIRFLLLCYQELCPKVYDLVVIGRKQRNALTPPENFLAVRIEVLHNRLHSVMKTGKQGKKTKKDKKH